jgi:hypothetical protein
MTTEVWTRLVQQVDRLITELRHSRTEAARWRTRATELEGLRLRGEREVRLEEQAKDRELERLRRERKKSVAVIERMLTELEAIEDRVVQDEEAP